MTYTRFLLTLFLAIFSVISVIAQDEEDLPVVPYFQSTAFNVPVLDDWEDQSADNIAQFYQADAQATIRTTVVNETDAAAGAQQDLEALLGTELDTPTYSEKVNLADGTWTVLVYRVDEDTTASAMARLDEGRTFVISFVESNPNVEIIMATIAHAEDSEQDDPTPEIATAIETFTSASVDGLTDPETMTLPSGEWTSQSVDDVTVMGWVFGNDSYLAIAAGKIDNLPELANAYNTSLLGFFVTPDNSGYLALGLSVVLGTLALLAFSIIWRARNLQKDLAVIQQLVADDD